MKCKIPALLLSALFLLSSTAMLIDLSTGTVSAAESDFEYTDLGNGQVEITNYTGYEWDVIIPDTIDGKAVTRLGDRAFYDRSPIRSVTMPDSLTSIGNYTFWRCSSLTSVTIPDKVTSIGEHVFEICTKLTSVTLGENVTSIGQYAFMGTTLTSIIIPDSVTSIGNRSFSSLSTLTSVTLGKKVTTMGHNAFQGCSGLTSLIIKDGVTSIGEDAFAYCTALTSVVIPDSVTTLGYRGFFYCTSLASVTLGKNVTSIGSYAFAQCGALTNMVFDGNAPSVGSYWADYANQLTIYYHIVADGFTTPLWNDIPCYPLPSTPTMPTELTAALTSGQVALSWSAPDYLGDAPIDHYVIYLDGVYNQQVTGMSATVAGLANGRSYILNVSAHNSFGYGLNATIPAVLASNTITITTPATASFIANSSVTVVWSEDSITGIEHITVNIDGTSLNVPVTALARVLTDLSDGPHIVNVSAENKDGSIMWDEITFTVDTVKPVVQITSPDDGAFIDSSAVTVDWKVDDDNDIEAVEYSTNGGRTWSIVDSRMLVLTGLSDRTYTVHLRATDVAGNQETTQVSFVVDTTAPTVEILAPTDAFINTDSPTMQWAVRDATSGVKAIEYSTDGTSWFDAAGATSYLWSGLADGAYTFYVRAEDNAGNSATDEVSFVVDTVAPSLIITSPAANAILGTSTFDLIFDAGDAVDVHLSEDGGSWTTIPNAVYVLNLGDGAHTIVLRAFDEAGNMNEASVTFTIDTVAPLVSITSPTDGSAWNVSSISATWSATDATGIQGYQYKLDNGPWSDISSSLAHQFTDLADGEHTVHVRAIDAAGNANEASVSIVIDTVAPRLVIISPSDDVLLNASTVQVDWSAEDGSGVEGSQYRLDGGPWSALTPDTLAELSGLDDGIHTVEVRAFDTLGNVQTASVTFTADTVAPSVTITAPSGGALLATSFVVVEWTAEDSSGILSVEISIDEGAWTAVSGSYHELVDLSDGTHSVSVRVNDAAGHTNQTSVAILVDTTAPTVTGRSPTGSVEPIGSTISVTFSEPMNVSSVELTVSGVTGTIAWSGNVATFTPSASLNGTTEYTVTVSGSDLAGNSVSESWKFTTAEVAPVEDGGGDSTMLIIGAAAIVVVGAGTAVIFMRRRAL